jgi:hypothetical protein
VFLLHGDLSRGSIRLSGPSANQLAFDVQSDISNWPKTDAGSTGRKYEIE